MKDQGYYNEEIHMNQAHPLDLKTIRHEVTLGEYDAFLSDFENFRSHGFYGHVFYDFGSRDWIHNERIFVGLGLGAGQ